jgi:hypothetical protein
LSKSPAKPGFFRFSNIAPKSRLHETVRRETFCGGALVVAALPHASCFAYGNLRTNRIVDSRELPAWVLKLQARSHVVR